MNPQISMFDTPVSASPPTLASTNDPDAFGCCSRYRLCSDAHVCLIADQAYSSHCSYRKNLEAGRVFYGKNADGFSHARYAEYQRHIDALPAAARAALDALVINFCEYNRGSDRYIVRNDYIPALSALGLFEFRPLGSEFPPAKQEKWNYQKLLDLVLSHPDYGPLFRQAQAARADELKPLRNAKSAAKECGDTTEEMRLEKELKELYKEKPGEDTKVFLARWLNCNATVLRDELANPYRLASPYQGATPYIEEFYMDHLLTSYDQRIYVLSPMAEDGLLSDSELEKEEKRRVRLSRGCIK